MQLYLKQPSLPENYTLAVLRFVAAFYLRTQLSVFFILKDVLGAMLRLVSDPEGTVQRRFFPRFPPVLYCYLSRSASALTISVSAPLSLDTVQHNKI